MLPYKNKKILGMGAILYRKIAWRLCSKIQETEFEWYLSFVFFLVFFGFLKAQDQLTSQEHFGQMLFAHNLVSYYGCVEMLRNVGNLNIFSNEVNIMWKASHMVVCLWNMLSSIHSVNKYLKDIKLAYELKLLSLF